MLGPDLVRSQPSGPYPAADGFGVSMQPAGCLRNCNHRRNILQQLHLINDPGVGLEPRLLGRAGEHHALSVVMAREWALNLARLEADLEQPVSRVVKASGVPRWR